LFPCLQLRTCVQSTCRQIPTQHLSNLTRIFTATPRAKHSQLGRFAYAHACSPRLSAMVTSFAWPCFSAMFLMRHGLMSECEVVALQNGRIMRPSCTVGTNSSFHLFPREGSVAVVVILTCRLYSSLQHCRTSVRDMHEAFQIPYVYDYITQSCRPPLWSSGQSSWLQIRTPGFDSRHYQKKVVGLEWGALSLVSTTEELLDRKVAAPV
jgi:hypothetical protein